MIYVFPIAIHTEGNPDLLHIMPGRDFELDVEAENVIRAINIALIKLSLQDGELVHVIHVGKPRPV